HARHPFVVQSQYGEFVPTGRQLVFGAPLLQSAATSLESAHRRSFHRLVRGEAVRRNRTGGPMRSQLREIFSTVLLEAKATDVPVGKKETPRSVFSVLKDRLPCVSQEPLAPNPCQRDKRHGQFSKGEMRRVFSTMSMLVINFRVLVIPEPKSQRLPALF